MIQIRPVSDLRNKFTEIEKLVNEGQPVFLTKNGYGNMVVMSIEHYSKTTEYKSYVDSKLAESEKFAEEQNIWLTEEEVFDDILGSIDEDV